MHSIGTIFGTMPSQIMNCTCTEFGDYWIKLSNFIKTGVAYKAGNTPEHEHRRSHAELARHASKDSIQSRGKQARLTARPDPWAFGPSK